ncbi:reverse transcriptase [Gossypium australe]|uniref:Reverse transcriptase n=1 Tax=Gossypium australe TaxID=47621 RepID=A0A5B6V9P1_9ROSI|nr:reverse transcriptase [Gossypium australe]
MFVFYKLRKVFGLSNLVGRGKKEAFQLLKDRMRCKIATCFYLKEVKKFLKNQFYKPFRLTRWLCFFFYFRSLFVMKWKAQLRIFCGKRAWEERYYWCEWRKLCNLKENSGLGFRCFAKFNISLLAKQGWRLINYPNSLLAPTIREYTFIYLTKYLGFKRNSPEWNVLVSGN